VKDVDTTLGPDFHQDDKGGSQDHGDKFLAGVK